MGSLLGCCGAHAATLSLQLLREKLEGDRRRMNDRPEVWVTIVQVVFKDCPETTFSPAKFSLEGLRAHTTFEITGSSQQIIREIGDQAALKLMDKVRVFASSKLPSELTGSSRKGSTEVPAKVLPHVPNRAGTWDSKETKTFDLYAIMNMIRDPGRDEVRVEIKELEAEVFADGGCSKRVSLQSSELKKYIEGACCKRAWEVISQQVNEKLDKVGVVDP
mmetsp:Transcript_41321/g.95692  ORF Transcript_41321/g.95692 Transcript_41321/m.95692 type:complete len:219 (-) Transcript_41321:110-766(-)